MNIVIVYDSIFGNTAKIARAVADGLEPDNQVRIVSVQDAKGLDLSDTGMLVIGSPTRGFRPTPQISEYIAGLAQIPDSMTTAVFDTRLDPDTIDPLPLRWVVEVGGYAAARMAGALQDHGISVRGDLGGFLVTGTEGPLKAGELDRAREWAISLLRN
ncbi:MAG TPA: flavodoxin domain-containing protein [Devosia sp.]|nr:flavodoxin domain-containing protein [Devosia sp.]